MDRRIAGLLGICQKAGKLCGGEQACEAAVRNGSAKLVLLAVDASENTVKKFENQTAYYSVELRRIGQKQELGALLGKAERAVLAIADEGFSEKLKQYL